MVAAPAPVFCPAGTSATLPSRSTFPVTDLLPGSVICARSPFFTSPCCDGSRANCTSSVSDVADMTVHPTGSQRPGLILAQLRLQLLERGRRLEAEGARGRVELRSRRVPEVNQVGVELGDIGSAVALRQRPVRRRRATQQRHRLLFTR